MNLRLKIRLKRYVILSVLSTYEYLQLTRTQNNTKKRE
jgi:hypothetical protein